METINVELYFDLRSHRARVTWGREDRILRDTFPNREAAEAAALAMIRKTLSSNIETRTSPEICVWSR
jgi:hypothetical protein